MERKKIEKGIKLLKREKELTQSLSDIKSLLKSKHIDLNASGNAEFVLHFTNQTDIRAFLIEQEISGKETLKKIKEEIKNL